jgi:hypothetical protein
MNAVKALAGCLLAATLNVAVNLPAHADDGARFDLDGPKVDVRVTRGNVTLPIAKVPNLLPGDKIWVKADLPSTQSNHLLLIIAFLRGTTNEPPDSWFTEVDTWEKKTVEGTTVTVPAEAQQALIFIAPETGGDFKTLRSAVKGRPGVFIRADADLNEASFEQQRIQRYLEGMQSVAQDDPKAIADRSAKLAATLGLKPNPDCFKKPVELQVNCLTLTSAPVLLDDGHATSIAEAVSAGPTSDFVNAASYTAPAGGGLYSPYVGAVVDLVSLVSSLRTAKYQYIPAISFPKESTLNLKLNTPPSFNTPKTVIVIGLPAIQKAKLPPLHAHDPNQVACLLNPKMTLPVDGAPLVFSTSFAHDLVLHLNRTGDAKDIPLDPDAMQGGLIEAKADARVPITGKMAQAPKAGAAVKIGSPSDTVITGTIRGYWGFEAFEGPTLSLQQVDGKNWKIVGNSQLLAGQDNKLTLKGDGTGCVEHIALSTTKDKDVDVNFKPADGKDAKDMLALDASLKEVQPGGYALTIKQYGEKGPDRVSLTAYDAGIKLESLKMHAGDKVATLTGEGLKDVASVELGGQTFAPDGDGNDDKTVHLEAKVGVSPTSGSDATVKLKDGRTMTVKVSTEAARPSLQLVSLKSAPVEASGTLAITLGAKDDIPLNSKLTFVVQTKDAFPRTQTVEVATADEGVKTMLSLSANTLVLQDEHTAVGTLDPAKAFGQSAFGKLQMRPVAADGTPGDWTALGTLVRTPKITGVDCADGAATCTAKGSNLFLIQSVSGAKDFAKAVDVPTGFAEDSFAVPAPADGTTLYLKLRDDAGAVASLVVPAAVQPTPAAPAAAAVPAAMTAPAAATH